MIPLTESEIEQKYAELLKDRRIKLALEIERAGTDKEKILESVAWHEKARAKLKESMKIELEFARKYWQDEAHRSAKY